jgi:serine/threonine protein kinase
MAPELDPLIGTSIKDYVLVQVLGRGAMGMVYLARHPETGQQAAVKFLSGEFTTQPEFVNRFINEAAAAAALQHENIIHVYEAGQDDGTHFMIMEYVDGVDLGHYLETQEKVKESQVLPWLKQSALGLGYAHSCGIIHRDLKPANIMLTRAGLVKIADLGLLKNLDSDPDFSLTMSGTVIGTPYYISPEQARDAKHVDPRTDIYSLGATFYHLTTGRPPFQGNSAAEIMAKHMSEPVMNPQRKNVALSDGFSDMLVKMLEKDPDRRFQSMDEIIQAVERLEKGEKVIERKVRLKDSQIIHAGTPMESDWQEKIKPIGIGVVVLALLLAVGFFWMKSKKNAPTAAANPVHTVEPAPVPPPAPKPPPVQPAPPPPKPQMDVQQVLETEQALIDKNTQNPKPTPTKTTNNDDMEEMSIVSSTPASTPKESSGINWVDLMGAVVFLLGIPAARMVGAMWGFIRAVAFAVAVYVIFSVFPSVGSWFQHNLAVEEGTGMRAAFVTLSLVLLLLAWVLTHRLRGHQKETWQSQLDRNIAILPGALMGAVFAVWFLSFIIMMSAGSFPMNGSWIGSRILKNFPAIEHVSKLK